MHNINALIENHQKVVDTLDAIKGLQQRKANCERQLKERGVFWTFKDSQRVVNRIDTIERAINRMWKLYNTLTIKKTLTT